MHAVVMDSLEDYLSGLLEPVEIREIEAHLSTCQLCREQVRSMQDTTLLFETLRSEEIIEPSAAFCARVMQEVGELKPAPTFASFFSLDLAFARRLVFASLLTLAVVGSLLVTRESTNRPAGMSPEAIMAQQDSPTFDTLPASDNMLITLTTYEH